MSDPGSTVSEDLEAWTFQHRQDGRDSLRTVLAERVVLHVEKAGDHYLCERARGPGGVQGRKTELRVAAEAGRRGHRVIYSRRHLATFPGLPASGRGLWLVQAASGPMVVPAVLRCAS